MLKYINDNEFNDKVINGKGVVAVDFYADWCAPCKMLSPVLEEIQEELKDEIEIVKINVDNNPVTSLTYNVQSIPTVIIFKDGKLIDKKVGFVPKEFLKEAFEEVI